MNDYQLLYQGNQIQIDGVVEFLTKEEDHIDVLVDGDPISFNAVLTRGLKDILLAGGLLNYVKAES